MSISNGCIVLQNIVYASFATINTVQTPDIPFQRRITVIHGNTLKLQGTLKINTVAVNVTDS